jgi:hypothetical protein
MAHTAANGHMASHDYSFVTIWRLRGTREEVSAILEEPAALPRWWPSVYLDVREVGAAAGTGRTFDLWTRGRLPYTLRWRMREVESRRPAGFSIEASGDFVGRGVWTFDQEGPFVNIRYEWRIRAEKPLLKYLSFLLKPVFAANHRWAMARGQESLERELARRRTEATKG